MSDQEPKRERETENCLRSRAMYVRVWLLLVSAPQRMEIVIIIFVTDNNR